MSYVPSLVVWRLVAPLLILIALAGAVTEGNLQRCDPRKNGTDIIVGKGDYPRS